MASSPLCSSVSLTATLTPPHFHHTSTHLAIIRLPSSAFMHSQGHFATLHPRSPRLSSLTLVAIKDTDFALFLFTEIKLEQEEVDTVLKRHPNIESAAVASLESLRFRIDALLSIGLTNSAIRRSITKRPDILTSPETGLFLNFVHKEAVKLLPTKLERLLTSTHSNLLPGLIIRVRLFLDHEFPQEKLGHLLNAVDIKKVFCERSIEDIEETIMFLQGYGWPDIIVRRPILLNMNLHNQLIPRVQFFNDLAGACHESSAILIRKLPAILAYTVEHLESHLQFWRSVGLTDEQVFKISLVYPNIFSVSRERKLSSRIQFLEQCGLDAEHIFKFLIKAPLFVSLSFQNNLAMKLSFLVKLGYRYRTVEMALAVGAATRTSIENMQRVIGLFFSYGFSHEDVLAMSRKHPQVLQYNCDSLEQKMEFLVHDMERDLGELLSFPAFLGYKLDDRIRRRYEMNKVSNGKGLSINNLLSVSNEKFCFQPNKQKEAASSCVADPITL